MDLPWTTEVIDCGRSGTTVDAKVKLGTSLEPRFEMAWGGRGFRKTIKSAVVSLKGEVSADAVAVAASEAKCDLKPITLPGTLSWMALVLVGHVPVPITFRFPIVLRVSAAATAETSLTAKTKLEAKLGVRYHDRRYELIRTVHRSPPKIIPAGAIAGSAEATIGPDVEVEAGWSLRPLGKLAANATIGLRGGVRFGYSTEDPVLRTCAPFVVDGSLAFQLARSKLAPWSGEIYKRDLKCDPPKEPDAEKAPPGL